MKNGKLKLCLTASSGGHLEELSCLESLMKNYPVFTVTEKCDFGEYCFGERQYYVRQINRKESRFFLAFSTNINKVCSDCDKRKTRCYYFHRSISNVSTLFYWENYWKKNNLY